MARDEITGAQRYERGRWRDPSTSLELPPSPPNLTSNEEPHQSQTVTEKHEKVEQIHSGHFMTSNPHRVKKHGYNFEDALKSPTTSYRFGKGEKDSFEIDSSFAKLFECLSLAYNGAAIISPKWKSFKGMKLSWKDKIRLNNAIWREWHCQFVFGRNPVLCSFSFPISEAVHSTPQAVVLEGKYWKRTLGTVVKEYMKWRAFFRKRRASSISSDVSNEQASSFQDQLLQEILGPTAQGNSPEPTPMVLDEEVLLSEFTDTLFTSLNHNFLFPNPKELSHMSTNADIMQPGLVQLQPSIDELMDTFEPLQDVMKSVAQSPTPSTFVFTGNNSGRQILQPGQFSLSGTSNSTLQEPTADAVSLEMSDMQPQNLMDNITLQQPMNNIGNKHIQILPVQEQHCQQIIQQQQLQQFSAQQQQQMSSNQQLGSQQFIISQQQAQQQQLTQQDLGSQLVATQQQLDEVTRQVTAAQQQLTQHVSAFEQQQQVASQQFGNQQLQQHQQQIQLMQQQQQQLMIQQQSQQNQLKNLGITLTSVPQPATLHSAAGDTTHILLNSADISNLQTQIGANRLGTLQPNSQTLQGLTAQQVLNPLTSVQVRIAPSEDMNSGVKVGTPIHQLAVAASTQHSQIQHVQQQQQQQQSTHGMGTLSQAQNAPSSIAATSGQTQLSLRTILSGGNQTQAINLLQRVANQVSQSNNQQQQPQQQRGIAMQQQNDNKAIITQIFGQNLIPTGTANFVSVQAQPMQQQQQSPFPIQITKAPLVTTRMSQSVIKTPTVTSQAKVASQTKASNALPQGAKAKTKRQSKAKMPTKIAPAPPVAGAMNLTTNNNAALLTQLLTQGRFESAVRAHTAPQPTTSVSVGNTLLIQPVKTELGKLPTCAIPVSAINVTTDLQASAPFLGLPQSQSFPTTGAATTTTSTIPVLGISSVLSTPPKLDDKSHGAFTIGVVSSSPQSPAEGVIKSSISMEQVQMMDSEPQAQKKDTHISAEHKRRVNIKSGFDMLNSLVPSLCNNPASKISKAQMLQKAVEYTKKLQVEKAEINEEIETLRQEVAGLNVAISETQSQLPASGVPVTRQRFDMMKDIYNEYVRDRTKHNWKFYIFSIIIRPLFESYNASVSTANTEELFRTVLAWLDQHCSLLALRPTVLSSLTLLSRTTSILSDPEQVPQQAAEAVSKRSDDDAKK